MRVEARNGAWSYYRRRHCPWAFSDARRLVVYLGDVKKSLPPLGALIVLFMLAFQLSV
jgi:hypothetical protein